VLVWDTPNTHVSAAMTELITARPWLTVFRLPPYALELNPVERVWSHLKRSLAYLTKHNIADLTALVTTRLKRMRSPAWRHQNGAQRPDADHPAGHRNRAP
jgi:transposase